jgi:hypothetical protein
MIAGSGPGLEGEGQSRHLTPSPLNFWKRLRIEKKNFVVFVRKRTIPTERPQPVGEVNANFS